MSDESARELAENCERLRVIVRSAFPTVAEAEARIRAGFALLPKFSDLTNFQFPNLLESHDEHRDHRGTD